MQIFRFDRLKEAITLLLNNLAEYTHVFLGAFLL